jgi:hypothetical protein
MRPTNYPFYSTTQSVFGVFAIKGCIRQEGPASVRLESGKQAHLGTELASWTWRMHHLGYPFEKSVAREIASGISIEDAMVFGGVETARPTLSLSGTSA